MILSDQREREPKHFFVRMQTILYPSIRKQKTFAAVDDTYPKQERFVLLRHRDLSVPPDMPGTQ